MKPKAHYDPATDSLTLFLSTAKVVQSEEVSEDLVVSYGQDGKVVAIEFVDGARSVFRELLDSAAPTRRAS